MKIFIAEKFKKIAFSRVFSIFLTVAFSFLLPVLVILRQKPDQKTVTGSGFAVLLMDERYPDAEINTLLTESGIKNVICASNQWFFLNNFEEIERVPLDRYEDRLSSFDPRNDGYAEKARSIFLSEGKRRFFIPLTGHLSSLNTQAVEQCIINAMENRPNLGIIFKNVRQDNSGTRGIFIAAAFLLLLMSSITERKNRKPYYALQTLAILPSFVIVGSFGTAGFALCAILMVGFQLSRAAVLDFFVDFRYSKQGFDVLAAKWIAKIDKKTLFTLILSAVMIISLGIVGKIGAHFVLSTVSFSVLALLSSCFAISGRIFTSGHVRFMFVPIRKPVYSPKNDVLFSVPWMLAALFAFALSFFSVSGKTLSSLSFALENDGETLVSEADYLRHINFQRDFAFRRLESGRQGSGFTRDAEPEERENPPYLRYQTDDIGLLSAGDVWQDNSVMAAADFPAFPLDSLIAFLNNKERVLSAPAAPSGGFAGLVILLLWYGFLAVESRYKHRKKSSFKVYRKERKVA